MTTEEERIRTLRVEALTRVEGEGAMHVETRNGEVVDVQLRIYEPPRFFEAFLRGRAYTEPPDLTARICGICPVAYQMSACRAIEDACGVVVEGPLEHLRRLLYCGEWIESHALHIYLLHAPDFLGVANAIELAALDRVAVERGLRLKKVGNSIIELVGGRAIHPVNVRVGGFYRTPRKRELAALIEPLEQARDDAAETVRWVAGFEFPDYEEDYTFVAGHDPGGYPVLGESLVSNRGLDAPVSAFLDRVVESHVAHSTALHAHLDGDISYLAGPLARFSLFADHLAPPAYDAASDVGLTAPCNNPFRSIVVRAVETLHACDTALRFVREYEEPDRPAVEVEPRAAVGHGCTEAPRGLLYHRYELDATGTIVDAVIVPPTSQNQSTIERDLWRVVEDNLDLDDAALTGLCEQTIRNYDPCISCAAHFLDFTREAK
jgi:coenzyme F420-reducing hydrogenase alpha subunit